MDRLAVSRSLDGGFVIEHHFDLLAKTLRLRVEVLDAGKLSCYHVEFVSVSDMHFIDDSMSLWERLELRQIVLDEAPEGSASEEWNVWMNFWDTAELRLRCARIVIDNDTVR